MPDDDDLTTVYEGLITMVPAEELAIMYMGLQFAGDGGPDPMDDDDRKRVDSWLRSEGVDPTELAKYYSRRNA